MASSKPRVSCSSCQPSSPEFPHRNRWLGPLRSLSGKAQLKPRGFSPVCRAMRLKLLYSSSCQVRKGHGVLDYTTTDHDGCAAPRCHYVCAEADIIGKPKDLAGIKECLTVLVGKMLHFKLQAPVPLWHVVIFIHKNMTVFRIAPG